MRQQDKFTLTQRTRLVEEEAKGEAVPKIEGYRAPKKVAIAEKFASNSKATITEMQKRMFKLQQEMELARSNE